MIPIEIERVCKRFGGAIAVDGITLSIRPGELFFVLGPSGCGKTTLLRCIAGFCDVDEGAIRFGDQDITRVPAHRRNTGMVFQSYALWPHLSVADNVAFGLKERRVERAERDRRVKEALARVQMDALASRRPNQLSGGQQQRVALARALVIEPVCLLLDEPLSNLDARLRLEMREEIRAICKRAGITAVYVTHDQKEALSIADRVAVLDRGRVRQVGTPRDIYRHPVDAFVAGFIGETNLIASRVVSVNGAETLVECPFGKLRSTSPSAGLQGGAEVRVSLRPESIRLGDVQPGAPGFPAKIVHSVYLGELAQHRVVLAERTEVKVFEMNPRRMASDGQPVDTQAWVDPADVVVLPA